jgi:hypothetical protein
MSNETENLQLMEMSRRLEDTQSQLDVMTDLVKLLVFQIINLTSVLTKYQIPEINKTDVHTHD